MDTMKTTNKKKIIRNSKFGNKSIDVIQLGNEPEKCNQETLVEHYNWYNYFHDHKTSKKYFYDYLRLKGYKQNQIKNSELTKIDMLDFPSHIGWLCRMSERGLELTETQKSKIDEFVNFFTKKDGDADFKKPVDTTDTTKLSIQDHINNSAKGLYFDIEDAIIDFIDNNFNSDFSAYNMLKDENIGSVVVNKLIAKIEEGIKFEIQSSIDKVEDYVEAYSFLKLAQKKKVLKYVDSIISDCNRWMSQNSKVKKTRKTKPVSVEKLFKTFKYKKEDDSLKVVGQEPYKIKGATSLWVINCNTNQITNYVTDSRDGFSVKGTTLLNYDTEKSKSKRFRKSEDAIDIIMKGGKLKMRKLFESNRNKFLDVNGRFNEHTLILKIEK